MPNQHENLAKAFFCDLPTFQSHAHRHPLQHWREILHEKNMAWKSYFDPGLTGAVSWLGYFIGYFGYFIGYFGYVTTLILGILLNVLFLWYGLDILF